MPLTEIQYRKLTEWPLPLRRSGRGYDQFRATYSQTVQLVEDEIAKLQGTDIVVSGFMSRSQVRRDGWPLSEARVDHPGIIVEFRSKTLKADLRYADDAYVDWKGNLRGIGLTLEALRAVRRYGAVDKAQQYEGFRTDLVRTSSGAGASIAAKELAATVLILLAGSDELPRGVATNSDLAEQLFRVAAPLCHPDRGGGAERWHQLQAAIGELRATK